MKNEEYLDQTGELEMIDIHQAQPRREAGAEAAERKPAPKRRPPEEAPRQRPAAPPQRAAAPQQRAAASAQRNAAPQRNGASQQKAKPRKKKGGGGMIIFSLIFLLTLGAAGYVIYRLYDKLSTERDARIDA